MYESIRVQNFRGLKDLTIENLGRVNLLVGANNVGKTSVLEALALLRATADGTEFRQMLTSRGYQPEDSFTDVWAELIYDDADGFVITGNSTRTKHGVTGFTGMDNGSRVLQWHPVTNYLVQIGADGKNGVAQPALILVHFDPSSREETSLRSLNDRPQTRISVPIPDSRALPTGRGREAVFGPTLWLPLGYSFGIGGLADALTRIQGTRRYEGLIEALRSFDDRLTGLFPGYDSQARRPVVRVGSDGMDSNIGFPTLGDGVRRLVELVIAAPLASAGVVLIDEIESGVYYDNHAQLWDVVSDIAIREDIQIFATTHSWECVEAALKAFDGEHAKDFRLIRLERDDDDIRAVTAEHHEVESAVALGFDVR